MDLDSRSSVLGGERGGLVENMMNKRQDEEEATILLDCPPPVLSQWSAGESRVWKQLFNFTVCLRFSFHDQTVYFFVGYFYCCKTLALGLSDGRSVLTVVGSFMPIYKISELYCFIKGG
ncbi:unnamed protein product [Cuscuta epithymum]|nr:unnamed protein product [Cuscuta epithymum]